MKPISFALIIPALLMIACGGPDPVEGPPPPTLTQAERDQPCATRGELRCSEDLQFVYLCADTSASFDTWVGEHQCDPQANPCGWTDVDAGTIGCVDSGE